MRNNSFKIQSSTFKNGIIKEAQAKFCDIEFVDKLDTNTHLLGFNNGVYDLENDDFRPQKPSDYISLSVGYDYSDKKNPEATQFVETFLRQVYPNQNVRNYVLKMFARQLIGDSCGNYVHIHSGHNGSAANGKSTFFEILTLALGRNYITKFDINDIMFAKKGGVGSSAEPMKANWKGKRILYASEPEKNAQIQSQLVKDISGDETVKFRLNHSNVYYEFEPMYKIHIMCNDKPKADMNDEGVLRRLVNIEYISQFVNSNSVDESQNKFKMINNIKSIFKNDAYKFAFFKIIKNHLDPNWDFTRPPEIENATNTYRTDNNPLLRFVDTYFEYTNNDKDGVSLKEIKDYIKIIREIEDEDEDDSEKFVSKIDSGRDLKLNLVKILKTKCIPQATVKNSRKKNVFRSWAIKIINPDIEQ
jgi:P4 family phage/plasmid primase-like protien